MRSLRRGLPGAGGGSVDPVAGRAVLSRMGRGACQSLSRRGCDTRPRSRSGSGPRGLLGRDTGSSVLLLGGNQSNGVSVAAFAKSRVLGYRWPLPASTAVSLQPPSATSTAAPKASIQTAASQVFETALAHVLEMEGGYTDDPSDPGGPTNFGITLADYAGFLRRPISDETEQALVAGLKQIPAATVRSIYMQNYWLPAGSAEMPAPFAFFHFDTAVNMGVGTAIRMLQTAAGCAVDGEVGPLTLAALTQADLNKTLGTYADLRRRRYRSLSTFSRFGRGWLARVDTTLARALALASSSTLRTGATSMTNSQTSTAADPTADIAKWWGNSSTVWGAVVTGLAAVLPALGPAVGVSITPDTIHTGADQVGAIVQALAGLVGTIATIRGRVNATQPLKLKMVSIKI